MTTLDSILNDAAKGGEKKSLGEIGTFTRGNGLQKKDFCAVGLDCIHYGQIYTHYDTYATETISKVSPELYKKLRKAKRGDLIIATTSENEQDVCKAVAWLGEEPVAISGDAYIFSHSENPKYISYLFQSEAFYKQKKKVITGTKVLRVSGESMAKFTFVFPSLDIQEKVVSILDKMAELQAELQAELLKRQKQYKYYLNKLFEQPISHV